MHENTRPPATVPSPASARSHPTSQPSDALSGIDRAVKVLSEAHSVIIIPGYGMALAQAQFVVTELANTLERMGKAVAFAIHPVAGRMPGHMNVLLAEAGISYDKLLEMDVANPRFAQTDVALVVGGSDMVNLAAIQTEGTPISGMPILLAHEAKNVIVCNLDDRPGYSGVHNPLYDLDKTIMLLGDAKFTIATIIRRLQPTPA